jgi:hypothetical protein
MISIGMLLPLFQTWESMMQLPEVTSFIDITASLAAVYSGPRLGLKPQADAALAMIAMAS